MMSDVTDATDEPSQGARGAFPSAGRVAERSCFFGPLPVSARLGGYSARAFLSAVMFECSVGAG